MKKSIIWTVIIIAVLMTTLTGYGQLAQTPWPKHHKDAQNTGMADAGTPFFINPAVQWQRHYCRRDTMGEPEYPACRPLGNYIYVAGNKGAIVKLDAATGALQWTFHKLVPVFKLAVY